MARDLAVPGKVNVGSGDSKQSVDPAGRRVGFDQSVRVILIPSRDEYRKVGLYGALWWSGFEFSQFQASAHNEIRALALEEGIGARAARRKLYQPSLNEKGKWGEMKSQESENSMIAKNMLKVEEANGNSNKSAPRGESTLDSLKKDATKLNACSFGPGIGTQSPTDSLKVAHFKKAQNADLGASVPVKAGKGDMSLGKPSAAASPASPPRYTKRTFDIANYNSEEILNMSPVSQNRKLFHSGDGATATAEADSAQKNDAAPTSTLELVVDEDNDEGSVHTDSDTDMEEEGESGKRGQGEHNFVVNSDEEGDAPLARMHRTSSLQEISLAVQRSDSVSNLKLKAGNKGDNNKNNKEKKSSHLVVDTTSAGGSSMDMQQVQDQEDAQPSLDEPEDSQLDTHRSLHSIVTSRAPFSPAVPSSSSRTDDGDEGHAASWGKEQTVGGEDGMEAEQESEAKPAEDDKSSPLSRNYEPDSWEALRLSVPLLKPAVLDDMSAKRRFSSRELWSKQKSFVGATMDFLGIGAMGPWRMLGWVVVACSMYIITTDASSDAVGSGLYDSAGDLGAKALGNENISF